MPQIPQRSNAAADARELGLGGVYEQIAQYMLESTTDSIVAHAGGGQTNATPLVSMTNRITVAASVGDSVRLPASQPGLEIMVINHGANAVQVYGTSTDTINDVATGTGVSQMANSIVIYTAASTGAWYTDGLALGYSGSLQTSSFSNGIVAHAGGGQAAATPLTTMLNRVLTVATIGDSVQLPLAVPGLSITVTNAATNSMNLYSNYNGGTPADSINGAANTAAYAVAGGKTVIFNSVAAGLWHAVLSA